MRLLRIAAVAMRRARICDAIEPALTVPSERIYIRLEDMILITESGARILSDFVPRSIEAVERLVAEPGVLQRHGRIRR